MYEEGLKIVCTGAAGYGAEMKGPLKNVQKDADCKTESEGKCFTSTIKVGGAAVCTNEMKAFEASMKTFVELPGKTDGTGKFGPPMDKWEESMGPQDAKVTEPYKANTKVSEALAACCKANDGAKVEAK